MVDRDLELSRCRLRQAALSVPLDLGRHLRLLLAGRGNPPGEPFGRQLGLCRSQPPWAGANDNFRPAPAELVARRSYAAGPEGGPPRRRPPLVRIERRCDAAVEWIGWTQFNAADD